MSGIFDLRTPADLRKKLNVEYEQLKADPTNSYVAFNLFVTAEHLLDWLYPGKANGPNRTHARKTSMVLQICSHIANGAKHFEVEDHRHTSVSATDKSGGYFHPSYFGASYFGPSYFGQPRLVIRLVGAAKEKFGESLSVEELAKLIVDYWNGHPGVK